MPNQFFSPEGDLENYFVDEYWLIDQYIGDQLWTWGSNGYGGEQGTNQPSMPPNSIPVTTFAGGNNWKQISLGLGYTAGIKTDGTLWLWGKGYNGELGNARVTNTSTPITTFTGGNDWKQVALVGSTALAIKTDGTLWTWGYGGVTGNGAGNVDISTPITTFVGGSDWKQIAGGWYHALAIKTDGTLWTWGDNSDGALGRYGDDTYNITNTFYKRLTPVTTFAGGTNWADTPTLNPEDLYTLSGGSNFTAAIKTDGTLWTWGNNAQGQLAINVLVNLTPVTTFAGGTNWKQLGVGSGSLHTVAVKTDGTLWVWGYNFNGQLGNANIQINALTPVTTFAGGTNWKQVSGGNNHTAAIKTDGTLWCWGAGAGGRLGNFSNTTRPTPLTTFAGGTNWKQVIAGDRHTAAVKTDGTLWSWGYGTAGRLGNAVTTGSILTPVTTFAGGTNWKQVSTSGYGATLAVKTDGTLWGWGSNSGGQLGNASITNVSTPVTTFAGGTNWKQVSCGGYHVAAVKTDGTLWTWGSSSSGELGTNDVTPNRSTPVTTFAGGTTWKQVSGGFRHTVALQDDGVNKRLYTFGSTIDNQLGIGINAVLETIPGKLGNSNDWKQAAGGRLHSAAVKTDGTLWTWGFDGFSSGYDGQLGINQGGPPRYTPVTTFAGGTNWRQVACGANHTIAIKTNGTLWVWGNTAYGQTGFGPLKKRYTPVTTFAGGTNWADTPTTNPEDLYTLYSSGGHSLAIKTDGTLWIWGQSFGGNLGINAVGDRSTPVTTFAGGTNWKQVSAGNNVTAAIKTDGTLWTWGRNTYGQLGNAATTNTSTPITTFAGGTNWKQVSCSGNHIAAVKTDGTLWLWGRGFQGQLGNNEGVDKLTPVTTFAGGTNWKQVNCGGSQHTAAIKTDGTLWTWGANFQGRLGNASITNVSTPVTTFAGGTDWKQVSCGFQNTAAIKTDGTLWAWGSAYSGQLGNNNTTDRSTPVTTFAGGTNWKQVIAGGNFAAVKTDGTLWTWGYGGYGELGNERLGDSLTPVTTFAGGTNWKQVGGNGGAVVALNDDGVNKRLYIFGSNYNDIELGLGQIQNLIPGEVAGNHTNWKDIDGGYGHTVAVKTDGTLWTWGYHSEGQLGNNTEPDYQNNRYTPVTTFSGGTNWKQVRCGRSHTAAIQSGINADYPLS